jgi:hypothetical protein
VEILVDADELKKIEAEHGPLKRVGKDKLKWLLPPEWSEKTFDGVVVEVPDEKAPAVFEKFRVKLLRKR